MEDEKIIDLYWQRDENAIKLTAEKYRNYCGAIARNILGNGEDAEECVNDTWLRTWNAIPPHKPEKLSLFLGKITRELAINRYKANSAQKRGGGEMELALDELSAFISSKNTVEENIEAEAVAKAINAFLRKQPEKQANMFILRYFHFYPISQIAAKYSASESKVKSVLFRMRKKLYSYLESEDLL